MQLGRRETRVEEGEGDKMTEEQKTKIREIKVTCDMLAMELFQLASAGIQVEFNVNLNSGLVDKFVVRELIVIDDWKATKKH